MLNQQVFVSTLEGPNLNDFYMAIGTSSKEAETNLLNLWNDNNDYVETLEDLSLNQDCIVITNEFNENCMAITY